MCDEYGVSRQPGPVKAKLRPGMHAWLWLGAAALVLPLAAAAAEPGQAARQDLGDDVYISGGGISLPSAVAGDAVLAGGRIGMTGRVTGDALAAGGRVDIESAVGQDLYAAGGEVRVAGTVGGSARLAGGRVSLAPGAQIAGGLTVAGGRVTVDGRVGRYALITAGQTEINGRIDGDLRVTGGRLSLGPDAVVQGRLQYHGSEPPHIDPGAQVQGGVAQAEAHEDGGMALGLVIVWLVGLIVAGAVLLLIAPRASRRVSQALRARPVAAPLLGVALMIGLPILAVLLMVTVVGIPLGILTVLTAMALLVLGYFATAAALGDLLVERAGPARTGRRILATAVALVALFAIGLLPYVGWLVWLLALLFGSGAIALAVVGAARGRPRHAVNA